MANGKCEPINVKRKRVKIFCACPYKYIRANVAVSRSSVCYDIRFFIRKYQTQLYVLYMGLRCLVFRPRSSEKVDFGSQSAGTFS